jgi:D-sedoheptulose 7-phosphate isomerase
LTDKLAIKWSKYIDEVYKHLQSISPDDLKHLYDLIILRLKNKKNIYIIGNGGSAANADHVANDFTYPVSKTLNRGIKAESLSSNSAILTCISNDEEYINVFSHQIMVKGNPGDLMIVFSGSGNSRNLIDAVSLAKRIDVHTYGIIGDEDSSLAELLDSGIFFKNCLMQNAEDLQTMVMHFIMLILRENFNNE